MKHTLELISITKNEGWESYTHTMNRVKNKVIGYPIVLLYFILMFIASLIMILLIFSIEIIVAVVKSPITIGIFLINAIKSFHKKLHLIIFQEPYGESK